MKKPYEAPHAEPVGVRLSQRIMDLIIDPTMPIASGEAPAAKRQARLEEQQEEDITESGIPLWFHNIWDEEE